MNYNNPIPQKTAGVIRYSCGFLFLAFCFSYLYFLQGDVLAEVQYVLSKGLAHYSILFGALIITVVLQILQWVVSLFIHVPGPYHALTYVPSFTALAMLTDMDQDLDGKFVWGIWNWLLPVLFVVWIILLILAKNSNKDESSAVNTNIQFSLWPNYLIILIMIIGCGLVPTTTATQLYEMKAERLIKQKDYEAAARVGVRSLESSPRLSRLLMYSLSKQDLLADSMFGYPQYYGTKGLMDISDTATNVRVPMRQIELYLGGYPGKTVKSTKRFLELLSRDSLATEQSKQYMMCYLLLDKDLEGFNYEFNRIYGDSLSYEVPRAYQEAIILQHPEFVGSSIPIYINMNNVDRYAGYLAMKDSITDKVERKNRTRREYGDTYWWYFDN